MSRINPHSQFCHKNRKIVGSQSRWPRVVAELVLECRLERILYPEPDMTENNPLEHGLFQQNPRGELFLIRHSEPFFRCVALLIHSLSRTRTLARGNGSGLSVWSRSVMVRINFED